MKIKIKIHPNSSREEIKKIDNNYEIWVKEKVENNKANSAIIKLLKNYFNSEVRIISGFKSKNKIVEINY